MLASHALVTALCFMCHAAIAGTPQRHSPPENFRQMIMNAPPYFPANTRAIWPDCAPTVPSSNTAYSTIQESGLESGWESKVSANWTFFTIPADEGFVTVIDYALKDNQLAYRYFANSATQNTLYEPWSSSKIMAYAGAMATLNLPNIPEDLMAGDARVADLITSINSYGISGKADGNSNAIATFFANIAGREFLTDLFHDNWLKLSNPDIRFRGAYGAEVFSPNPAMFSSEQTAVHQEIGYYKAATDDPYYQPYLCNNCNKNGNKPMTTLAEAEFLKRMVSQKRVPEAAMPGLSDDAVISLLYAPGHDTNANPSGGMMAGISRMLHTALANAIAPGDNRSPKTILDEYTHGQWRVFQKIGWGPSETRGQGETVVLAHVCLPAENSKREFTLAARTVAPSPTDAAVDSAAYKMQILLNRSIHQLLSVRQ